jgi:hypothetical protein
MIIVLGALTAVSIIAALVDTSLLRRKPPTVRARAADRRVRRFGGGEAGQADTQLATAPAAASPCRTRNSHQDPR